MTKNNKLHLGHRGRVKERFLKSSGKDFQDYELLEILLFSSHPRSDVKPLAKKLLQEFGSIKAIINSDPNLLKNIPGINDSAVVAIKIIQEIIIRNSKNEIGKIIIESWKSLLDYCQIAFSHLEYEQFRILFLDKNHQLIKDELHQEGSADNVVIDPVKIVKNALLLSCASVILIHNHPSGDSQPSKADITNTNKIIAALKVVGIKVHDHLIIADGSYYSFKNNGLI